MKGPYSFNKFTALEEKIGIYEIILTKMIIDDNVSEEMALSQVDDKTGRRLLNVTMDGGWNHRGSRRIYNSDSCQHVIYGGETKKIVALKTMSRACNKCTQDMKHNIFFCSIDFEGSSKSMEAYGAAVNVNWLFH